MPKHSAAVTAFLALVGRHAAAFRADQPGDSLLEEGVPLCSKAAPGVSSGCDASVSELACFSEFPHTTGKSGKSFDLAWKCSTPETLSDFNDEACTKLTFTHTPSNGGKAWTSNPGVYDGVCKIEKKVVKKKEVSKEVEKVVEQVVEKDLPLCKSVAPDISSGCDTDVSTFACFAEFDKITNGKGKSVDLTWVCSEPDNEEDFNDEVCKTHTFTHKAWTSQPGVYDGACRLKAKPQPKELDLLAPTDLNIQAPEIQTAPTDLDIQAPEIQTPKELEIQAKAMNDDLPDCALVAPEAFPGFCNMDVSSRACFSTSAVLNSPQGPVLVHWACSDLGHEDEITEESCKGRGWNYNPGNGEAAVQAEVGIYEGACAFRTKEAVKHSKLMSVEKVASMVTNDEVEKTTTQEKAAAPAVPSKATVTATTTWSGAKCQTSSMLVGLTVALFALFRQ